MQSASRETPLNAQTWRERLGESVRVELIDGSHVDGTLYTVDPDTQDVALLDEVQSTESTPRVGGVRIVFGHSIEQILFVGGPATRLAQVQSEGFRPFNEKVASADNEQHDERYSDEEALARQARVRALFEQHRIPFTEESVSPADEDADTPHTSSRHCFHVVGGLTLAW
eukprot:CAMPEP_0118927858 /NCGR_PEP_ID=MMETSP1169-20130426/5245_1 /TAXON_ID=36882 /ORGANISM="Pyramimonas obovata, Strain CCMP722" /LENGTH=169 /DNA_ID=CAMNT_0006869715 /DNA_START=70 /DNA_END=576 /DNA_ORIENTATION=+